MRVNLISSKDTREFRTIYVRSDNEEITPGMKQMTLLKDFLIFS